MRNAFGYCRVSGVSQADDDRDGIPRQREAITKWASANDVHIIRWFEESISGTTELDSRPELHALLQALHSNGTQMVVVEKVDRLARDLMIQESIIADFQRNKFEIVSTVEPDLCSADPTRILLRQMMGAFAQYERTMIVAKLRGARMRAKAKGEHMEGQHFYGSDPRRPEEVATLTRMRELRDSGLTYYAVAKRLDAEGLKPRKAAQWSPNGVQQILTRERA
jgi:DNA invertase Pin-like site-specific DNA recombinase